jgi:LysW-gamma-L-lysine carboxypeptidase
VDEGELLERLVRQYSPSGAEGRAVAEFVRMGRTLGYRTAVDAVGNGIASVGRGRPEILFLGHIDTVEGERPVRWTRDRLHGRGVVDAKGAIAAALIAGAGFPGPGTFRVAAAVGEETDSRGARHLLRGRRPDAVIAGEPSGWDGVTVGYKGVLRATAVFARRRRHYSSPFPTAADEAVAWAASAQRWARERSGESLFRSLTAKVVELHTGPSGDAETARVSVDVRLPPGVSGDEALRALSTIPGAPRLRTSVQIEACEPGPQDPVARSLVAAIRAEGGRPTIWRKSGTSDLNLALRAWHVPGAAYGPGDSRLDHTARESLTRRELRQSAAVLRRAVESLTATLAVAVTPRRPAAAP